MRYLKDSNCSKFYLSISVTSSSASLTMESERGSGGSWNYSLHVVFIPKADNKNQNIEVSIFTKRNSIKLLDLEGVNEKIVYAEKCKNPLFRWQLTSFLLNHVIVVFQTPSWFWSIEKNDEGIILQQSKNPESVKYYYRGAKRLTVKTVKLGTGQFAVSDMIRWTLSTNQLQKKYNVLFSNCKHFGKAVFKKHVVPGTVKKVRSRKHRGVFEVQNPQNHNQLGMSIVA